MATIKLRRSAVQGAEPTTAQLELGEVAINTFDGRMFIKKNDGADSIVDITAKELPTGGTSGQVLAKASAADYDVSWVTQSGGGSGLPLDASALSPNNGDILQFDATTNLWRAVTSVNIGNGYSQLDTADSERFVTASGNPFTVRNP